VKKVLIIFDTRYGNTHRLAEAIAEGAREVKGTEVNLRRVEITEPEVIIQQTESWRKASERFKAVPQVTLDEMAEADALIFGSPTRYGNMTASMKKLFDSTGRLWAENKLFGKVGAAFTSTSAPHGGNEMTLITMFMPMYHHGMIVVTPGYGDPALFAAGSPYGASSVSGPGADKPPTESDLKVARFLGHRVARVAEALSSVKT
jgi:NAD(P)H dehydrogenase (quinone)